MSAMSTIALLGGADSGKSTYLGALADALHAEQSRFLRLARAATDSRGFLNLMEPLQRGEYPQRTKAERHHFQAELEASFPGGSPERLLLEAGDYDGEEVDRLFLRTGKLTEEWQARAQARGILLFVRPDIDALPKAIGPAPPETARWEAVAKKRPAPAQTSPLSDDAIERMGYGISAGDMAAPPAQPGDKVSVPTSLALIDVLQFLRHLRGLDPGERPPSGSLRVAILLSAWDAVGKLSQEAGPQRYLVTHLSLLHDFLWSNFAPEDVLCFGLSSTGGDLKNAAYREQYLDSPQGFVCFGDIAGRVSRHDDLTLPVRWALFGDPALGPAGE